MRIVFMGTPDFAVPCLEALIDEKHDITAVFTQPDKPKGRGNKLTMPPIKELSIAHNIPVYQPKTIKETEAINVIKEIAPDLIVVVAYGHILTKEILDIPPFGCINVHASLLPKYRGAAPINWAIINGENTTGITTMYMDVGLDTGDMILKEVVNIRPEETAGELHDRLSLLGAEVLIKTIDLIEVGGVDREKQNEELASYAPIMLKELGNINWNSTSEDIKNLVRGTFPWPGAYTTYEGKIMKIYKCRIVEKQDHYPPGKIVEVTKNDFLVATKGGLLAIEELQFSGSKRMTVKDFMVGNTIKKGVVLGENYES